MPGKLAAFSDRVVFVYRYDSNQHLRPVSNEELL
jgi:hypothetical protein